MTTLFLDFETRSACDLKTAGSYRYLQDPSTSWMLVSVAFDDEQVAVYEPHTLPQRYTDAMRDPEVLKVAHNATFDHGVVTYLMGLDSPLEQWCDTVFMALYYAHPAKLSHLAKRLNCTNKLDTEDMLLFATPEPFKKKRETSETAKEYNRIGLAHARAFPKWRTKEQYPREWARFLEYSAYDVTVMRECYRKMPPLPEPMRINMWLTMQMNFNGFYFNMEFAERLLSCAKAFEVEASRIAKDRYDIDNLRSQPQVLKTLHHHGILCTSLNQNERGAWEHEILDLRDSATGSSFSKIRKSGDLICADGRIRGGFKGHGAHTGRRSGQGVQPQNFTRIHHPEVLSLDLKGATTYALAKEHMRMCIQAPEGKVLTIGDLAQIEARIVAWLANCYWRLETFRNGQDLYNMSYSRSSGIPLEEITKEQRFIGKTSELSLGYGCGANKFTVMPLNKKLRAQIGDAGMAAIVQTWRNSNPEVTRLWRTLETAWKEAMRNGRSAIRLGADVTIGMRYDGKDFRVDLPSGRAMYYRTVHFSNEDPNKIVYVTYDNGYPMHGGTFWGGTMLENFVQAIATDILDDVIVRVMRREPTALLVGNVHDEVWFEHAPDRPVLDVLLGEMKIPPVWAKSLPLGGDGFTDKVYHK